MAAPEGERGTVKKKNGIKRIFRVLILMLKRTRTPHRLALGFALGLFLSILPIPVAGMFIALGIAVFFRLNIISTYLGTLIVNPVTGVFFLMLDYRVGTFLFGTPFIKKLGAGVKVTDFILANIREIAAGSLVVAVLLGALSYGVIYIAARIWRRAHDEESAKRA
ncbi:MAG: DUF2062 domain-containing protein [Spirochaetes bacterium]|nr:DUF2062 domain-containing protein [Spirochaetota bacterium]